MPIGIDLVSAAVHQRFLAEGKPGAVMRSNAPYSTWFNGGDRTTTGFHNQIGLLAEIIGGPTPQPIPMIATKLLAAADQPAPIGPRQEWHQRQSIDYLVSSRSRHPRYRLEVPRGFPLPHLPRRQEFHRTRQPRYLDPHAQTHRRRRSRLRQRTGRAGRRSRGSRPRCSRFRRQLWTRYQPILSNIGNSSISRTRAIRAATSSPPTSPISPPPLASSRRCRRPESWCTAPPRRFTVAGKSYPAGSYVVQAAQAFRPHLRDMFEPQDHPNDFEYPGGPPKRPYDITGYTLAFQMGVRFDRILDGFDGPFEKLAGLAKTPAGRVAPVRDPAGYLLSHSFNDAFPATARSARLRRRDLLAQEGGNHRRHEIPAGHHLYRVEARHRRQARATRSPVRLEFRRGRVQTARRRLPVAPRENRPLGSLRRVDGVRPHTLALRAGLPRALRTGLRAGPQCRQSQK